MKFEYDSDCNMSLNKLLKLHNLIIVVRFVFQEGSKCYSQIFSD